MHIADGIQFVQEIDSSGVAQVHEKRNDRSYEVSPLNESPTVSHAGVELTKVDIIIVDVDSSDPR